MEISFESNKRSGVVLENISFVFWIESGINELVEVFLYVFSLVSDNLSEVSRILYSFSLIVFIVDSGILLSIFKSVIS